jgi:hypothetical protein
VGTRLRKNRTEGLASIIAPVSVLVCVLPHVESSGSLVA